MTNEKKVFSFRASPEAISRWRAWILASGRTVDEVAGGAMDDYIQSHPLDQDGKTIYEARLRQRKK